MLLARKRAKFGKNSFCKKKEMRKLVLQHWDITEQPELFLWKNIGNDVQKFEKIFALKLYNFSVWCQWFHRYCSSDVVQVKCTIIWYIIKRISSDEHCNSKSCNAKFHFDLNRTWNRGGFSIATGKKSEIP